jgi:hypothetical protein
MCLAILIFGCSKSEEPQAQKPTAATLVFPFENSLCNEGSNVTPTESTVLFEWKASNYTDSYTLTLKNLSTGVQTVHKTTNTEIAIIIDRATPYIWYVISESNATAETAQSVIWQFYNAGEGVQSYAPFVAIIESPAMAEEISGVSEITLKWTANDLDNDITGYDVYFGTDSVPVIYANDMDDNELIVSVVSDTIYYWRIITKDSLGNTSDTGVYQFRII